MSNALLLAERTILAELVLTLQARDLYFKANNSLEFCLEEIIRQIKHPGLLKATLIGLNADVEYLSQALIFNQARFPIGMDGCIVPGGDIWYRLIPGRRDIGMRSLEDYQRFLLPIKAVPLWVRPRQMAQQCTIGAMLTIQQERQVRGYRNTILLRYQNSKTIVAHQRVERRQIIFTERGRNVHVVPSLEEDQRLHSHTNRVSLANVRSPHLKIPASHQLPARYGLVSDR